jgi:hypothetical protein
MMQDADGKDGLTMNVASLMGTDPRFKNERGDMDCSMSTVGLL